MYPMQFKGFLSMIVCCKPYRSIHAPMEAGKAENGKHIIEKLKNIGKEGI